MPQNDLITTAQACEVLGGMHPSTINRWVQMGKLAPAHKLPGARGANLFRRRDIEKLAIKIAREKTGAA